jgi:hypothetical protein
MKRVVPWLSAKQIARLHPTIRAQHDCWLEASCSILGGPGSPGLDAFHGDTAALGQAKFGYLGGAVFLPNVCVEEDRGDFVDAVACSLTKVVGEVKVGDQLAGLGPPKLRGLGEAAADRDVDARCIPPLVWGGSCRPGCGGPGIPAARRGKEAEEESYRRRSRRPLRSRSLFCSPCGRSGAA